MTRTATFRFRATRAWVALAVFAGLATQTWADRVDDCVRSEMKSRRLPGVSLAVVKDGRIVKAAGYGLASLELRAPASENTVYEIGSISKQFAADAVMLLVENGKLKLGDPIAMHLPPTPEAWSAITIRHILTHTAGLADFDTGDIGFSYRREYTPEEFIELLARQPVAFQPGERWQYTNAFPLLGIIVERVSGMSYADFVRARIFQPLGLATARMKVFNDVVPNRAQGYLLAGNGYKLGEPLRPAIIAANGGVMMSVVDFARWDIGITRGRLLNPDSLVAITTPVRLTDGRTVSHGLGWFMDTFNGHRFGAHWGSTVAGYSAVIRRYAEGVTVVMLANLDDGSAALDAMSKRIGGMYVPGASIHSLAVRPEPEPGDSARVRALLAAVAAGEEHPNAPGLVARLPAAVRDRIAAAARTMTTLEYLGEERVGEQHFNLDPTVERVRWYRARTAEGMRFFTLRLTNKDLVRALIVEE